MKTKSIYNWKTKDKSRLQNIEVRMRAERPSLYSKYQGIRKNYKILINRQILSVVLCSLGLIYLAWVIDSTLVFAYIAIATLYLVISQCNENRKLCRRIDDILNKFDKQRKKQGVNRLERIQEGC